MINGIHFIIYIRPRHTWVVTMVIVKENGLIQVLDKAVCIPLHVRVLRKGRKLSLLTPAMGKIE